MLKVKYSLLAFLLAMMLGSFQGFSQTEIRGSVTDALSGDPLPGANLQIKGTITGASTDKDGKFVIRTNQEPPFTLVVSYIGYESSEVEVTDSSAELNITISESVIFGNEIVVSASRTPQTTLEAPVSVERIGIMDIRDQASPDVYDMIKNLKGVDMVTQSLTFQSVNMRGFGANGNTRLVQLIDGVDNQAPGLNFPVGNIVGISELDLESIEVLPGASSALYGPNALQGMIMMTSKSPFDYPGLSAYSRVGVNHVDNEDHDMSAYHNYGLRYAKSFNDKFAFKVVASYMAAQDFIGMDTRDQSMGFPEWGADSRPDGTRVYDGVNVYGDNVLNLGSIVDGLIASGDASLIPLRSLVPDGTDGDFSPLGYHEADFVDNSVKSLKLGTGLHYKINSNAELLGQFNYGNGSSVYTANDRFILDDFYIWTGKLELRGSNYFVRGYTTQENSGDTYAANTLAQLILKESYIEPYVESFIGARVSGYTVDESHIFARTTAENTRYEIGSPQYQEAYNRLREIPIPNGAKFLDESDLWHVEGNYNFENIINPETVEIVAGANYRQYSLNSQGTLFALDDDGNEFNINEYGSFVQLKKKIENLHIQASGRYDKNQNFKGQFSPRASLLYNIGDKLYLRGSFQKGFRIPTTQNQFISLDVVSSRLIGRNQILTDRWGFNENVVYKLEDVTDAQYDLANGEDINTIMTNLDPVEIEPFRTEKITTYEGGFRALLADKKLLMDGYYYFSQYTDFIAQFRFVQTDNDNDSNTPYPDAANQDEEGIIRRTVDTQVFGTNINADGTIQSRGFGLEAKYSFYKKFRIGANLAYDELVSQQDLIDQGYLAQFNTPKWKYNVSLSNREVTENFGFNVIYRWQQAFLWESSIGTGVVPEFGTLDAQVSYKLPGLKSIIKIGGSNILNERYASSFANPNLGAIYYIQLTFDEFLK